MAKIKEVENYTLITFEHNQSSALIYIRQPQELTLFQIDILENFFKRIMYYIGSATNIDIVIEPLPSDEFNVIAYLYNNQQDYDFCANFPNQFMAIHSALGSLFELSVNSQYDYDSINNAIEGEEADYGDKDYEEFQETIQEKEKDPQPPISKKHKDKLDKLGKMIDKILEDQDKDWPAI